MISTSPTHKTPATGQADKGASIIQVILEEAQTNESELNLDAELTDLGVDSLLSLTIASRLRDELGIDLPSSTLMNYSTVRAFVLFAGGEVSSDSSSVQSESSAGMMMISLLIRRLLMEITPTKLHSSKGLTKVVGSRSAVEQRLLSQRDQTQRLRFTLIILSM
jgi:acyl carrier protein